MRSGRLERCLQTPYESDERDSFLTTPPSREKQKRSLVELRHQASSLSNPRVVARNESGPRRESVTKMIRAHGLPRFKEGSGTRDAGGHLR
jgi:hypothetical protein